MWFSTAPSVMTFAITYTFYISFPFKNPTMKFTVHLQENDLMHFGCVYFSQFLVRSRFFRFRQAALSLMNTNKQSLPQEDPDAVMVDSPKENEDSVALQSFPSPTKSICSPIEDNDTHGLIGSSHRSSQASIGPEPLDHSSPKLPWEKLYQTEPHRTCTTLSNTFPRGSINSMRRASSVHEIEGYSNSKGIFRDRHTSEGMCSTVLHPNHHIMFELTLEYRPMLSHMTPQGNLILSLLLSFFS